MMGICGRRRRMRLAIGCVNSGLSMMTTRVGLGGHRRAGRAVDAAQDRRQAREDRRRRPSPPRPRAGTARPAPAAPSAGRRRRGSGCGRGGAALSAAISLAPSASPECSPATMNRLQVLALGGERFAPARSLLAGSGGRMSAHARYLALLVRHVTRNRPCASASRGRILVGRQRVRRSGDGNAGQPLRRGLREQRRERCRHPRARPRGTPARRRLRLPRTPHCRSARTRASIADAPSAAAIARM